MQALVARLVDAAVGGHTTGRCVLLGSAVAPLGSALLSTPGASSLVLEARAPYATEATAAALMSTDVPIPSTSFSSGEMAEALSESALRLGRAIVATSRAGARAAAAAEPVVGLGMTGAFRTVRERRGSDRAFVVAASSTKRVHGRVHFSREHWTSRDAQEQVVALMGLWALSHALEAPKEVSDHAWHAIAEHGLECSLHDKPPTDTKEDVLYGWSCIAPDAIERLSQGKIQSVLWAFHPTPDLESDAIAGASIPAGSVLVPGSFNPWHGGHEAMALAAARVVRGLGPDMTEGSEGYISDAERVVYELSMTNADKPPLDRETVWSRVQQFRGGEFQKSAQELSGQGSTIIVSRAPLFVEKARLFPATWLVVGYDTAARILMPKYYDGGRDGVVAALAAIQATGCRILVAARAASPQTGTGPIHTLDDLQEDIPEPFKRDLPPIPPHGVPHTLPYLPRGPLFQPIPAELFQSPLSSTAIRES